jgi:hypothetical protein
MKFGLGCLVLVFCAGPVFAQVPVIKFTPPPVFVSEPLTVDEIREGISRLAELKQRRQEVALLTKALADHEALEVQRAKFADDKLALANDRVKLLEERVALLSEKVTLYKDSYERLLKAGKSSGWCKLFRILTLGLKGC